MKSARLPNSRAKAEAPAAASRTSGRGSVIAHRPQSGHSSAPYDRYGWIAEVGWLRGNDRCTSQSGHSEANISKARREESCRNRTVRFGVN